MELRQLRYFVEVAASGTFSGAAKKLSMAQPSLWRSVKTLESELGFPLFESSPRGVKLTRAGATMLAGSQQLIELADSLAELGRELSRGADGLVVLGCATPQVPTLIAPLIGELHRRHPGIHVALRDTGATPDVVELLSSKDEVDFVTSATEIHDGVRRRFLADAQVIVVAAEGHPWRNRETVPLEELAGIPVILAAPNTLSRQLVDRHARELDLTLDIVFEADNLEAAQALAEAGLGIAVVGDHAHKVAGASRWPILTQGGVKVSTPVWLYWLNDRAVQNPPVQRFVELLDKSPKSDVDASR